MGIGPLASTRRKLEDELINAARVGDAPRISYLLNGGVDVNTADPVYGDSPLHWAADNGNIAIVKLLVHSGADCEARNKMGATPYDAAELAGRKEAAEYLRVKQRRRRARQEREVERASRKGPKPDADVSHYVVSSAWVALPPSSGIVQFREGLRATECSYLQQALEFVHELGLPSRVFVPSCHACYCRKCALHRGSPAVYRHGGGLYEVPHGWVAVGLAVESSVLRRMAGVAGYVYDDGISERMLHGPSAVGRGTRGDASAVPTPPDEDPVAPMHSLFASFDVAYSLIAADADTVRDVIGSRHARPCRGKALDEYGDTTANGAMLLIPRPQLLQVGHAGVGGASGSRAAVDDHDADAAAGAVSSGSSDSDGEGEKPTQGGSHTGTRRRTATATGKSKSKGRNLRRDGSGVPSAHPHTTASATPASARHQLCLVQGRDLRERRDHALAPSPSECREFPGCRVISRPQCTVTSPSLSWAVAPTLESLEHPDPAPPVLWRGSWVRAAVATYQDPQTEWQVHGMDNTARRELNRLARTVDTAARARRPGGAGAGAGAGAGGDGGPGTRSARKGVTHGGGDVAGGAAATLPSQADAMDRDVGDDVLHMAARRASGAGLEAPTLEAAPDVDVADEVRPLLVGRVSLTGYPSLVPFALLLRMSVGPRADA